MAERRKHDRYPALEMSFVVGLENPGQITDVSDGGLGVRYSGTETVPDEIVVDLLNGPNSVIIDKVHCRKVRDETSGRVAVFSYVSERRIGLEFVQPTPEQLSALALFISKEN